MPRSSQTVGYTPRYNIAPGDDLHIITNEAPDEIDRYHWGLIPFWADEPEEGIVQFSRTRGFQPRTPAE